MILSLPSEEGSTSTPQKIPCFLYGENFTAHKIAPAFRLFPIVPSSTDVCEAMSTHTDTHLQLHTHTLHTPHTIHIHTHWNNPQTKTKSPEIIGEFEGKLL